MPPTNVPKLMLAQARTLENTNTNVNWSNLKGSLLRAAEYLPSTSIPNIGGR